MSHEVEFGPLRIVFRPEPYAWSGQPAAGGDEQTGTAHAAAVTGPGGVALDLAVIGWQGSKEVAALDCHGSPPRIQRLGRGGRIGVHLEDQAGEWMELRISRMTSADWSSEYQTSLSELDEVCRLPVGAALNELGKAELGTRAELLSGTSRRRNELAVAFESGDTRVPIGAYCLVRVLPLLYGHGQENASLAG